jgi:hypothetical protein
MPESRWNDREGRFEIDRDRDFIDESGRGYEAGWPDDRDRYDARRPAPPQAGTRRGGELLRAQAQGGDIGYGQARSGAEYGPDRAAFRAPGDYGMVGGFDYGGGGDRYGGYGPVRPRHHEDRRDFGGRPYDTHRHDRGSYVSAPAEPGDGRGYRGEEDRSWFDRARDEVSSWMGDHDAQARRNVDARQGKHRGRGPRNYRRSDERIRDDVNDRLTDDSWLDAQGIEVTVADGEVTLTGTVRSREDKRRAEVLAESVSGVDNVQNNLRAARPETETRPATGTSGGTGMGGLV